MMRSAATPFVMSEPGRQGSSQTFCKSSSTRVASLFLAPRRPLPKVLPGRNLFCIGLSCRNEIGVEDVTAAASIMADWVKIHERRQKPAEPKPDPEVGRLTDVGYANVLAEAIL